MSEDIFFLTEEKNALKQNRIHVDGTLNVHICRKVHPGKSPNK